jgi:hypothetical protein
MANVDIQFARQLLDYCTEYHKEQCGYALEQIQWMKLIDCDSESIVDEPPNIQYAQVFEAIHSTSSYSDYD